MNMRNGNDMRMKPWFVSLSPICLPKVFETSEFASHPLFSVAQGGLDLQQVSIIYP